MIEISDSTATRRSERKRGKGRRAIDATTMMGCDDSVGGAVYLGGRWARPPMRPSGLICCAVAT